MTSRKRLIDVFNEASNGKRVKLGTKPLEGVVACLSGLPSNAKARLHGLIETLGGSYTRVFDLDQNTHLITDHPQGAKFELAMSSPEIFIVTPNWLDACAENERRMPERGFVVQKVDNRKKPPPAPPPEAFSQLKQETTETTTTTTTSKTKSSLVQQLDEALEGNPLENMKSIFECQNILLLGFEDDIELKRKLGKLIRRGLGCIYWEMNDAINLFILNDTCEEELRKAVDLATSQHPNMPYAVSPFWVLESWKTNCLALPSQFPPLRAPSIPPVVKKKNSGAALSEAVPTKIGSSQSILRGCLFALVRVAPPNWAVDFDSKQQESFVRQHGGQLLTLKLLDVLKADQKRGSKKRKCHVVCWGSRPQIELNPILSTIQRIDLCEIVPVSPFWIQTIVASERRVQPNRFPFVFLPQPFPFRKLMDRSVSIALTGFHWMERVALTQLIHAIGGTFDENMKNTSTHLVCKEQATGLKREKAIQWGLHIVSIDWFYHIVQYGFGGKEQAKDGCESKFSCR